MNSLKPISGNHSISRVIAGVHLPQPILKPELIFDKIVNDNSKFISYQKKSKTYLRKINFSKIGDFEQERIINGFLFEKYDSQGTLENIFKLVNNDTDSTIIQENKKYSNWSNFIDSFLTNLEELEKFSNLIYKSLSLTYVDEFIWSSEESIDLDKVFSKNSEYLSNVFFKTKNITFTINLQDFINGKVIEEKIDITFSNIYKNIKIIHQYAFGSEELKLMDKTFITNQFDKAHTKNKEILKSLLKEDVIQLIHLK